MMPNLGSAMWGLSDPLTYIAVSKTMEDMEITQKSKSSTPIAFTGLLVPIPQQKLIVKPEGQRAWKWWTLYSSQQLEIDWLVVDRTGTKLRVMNRASWQAGFYNYELVEGPTT